MQRRIIIENRRRPGIFLLGVFYAISQEIEYSRRKSNIIPRLRQMHQDGEFLYLTNPRWFTFWFRQFRLFSQSSDDAAPHRYRAVITISNYENLSGTFSQTSQIHSFSLEYFSIYVENTRNLIELVGEKKNFVCTIFLCRMHWLTNDGVHPTAVAAAMQTLHISFLAIVSSPNESLQNWISTMRKKKINIDVASGRSELQLRRYANDCRQVIRALAPTNDETIIAWKCISSLWMQGTPQKAHKWMNEDVKEQKWTRRIR